jgi:protein TonB
MPAFLPALFGARRPPPARTEPSLPGAARIGGLVAAYRDRVAAPDWPWLLRFGAALALLLHLAVILALLPHAARKPPPDPLPIPIRLVVLPPPAEPAPPPPPKQVEKPQFYRESGPGERTTAPPTAAETKPEEKAPDDTAAVAAPPPLPSQTETPPPPEPAAAAAPGPHPAPKEVAVAAPPPHPVPQPKAEPRAPAQAPKKPLKEQREIGTKLESGDPYFNALSDLIERHRTYPALARSIGLRGVATYVVEIDRDGNLIGIRILQSSGAEILDRTGIQMVQSIGKFPPVPESMTGTTIQIEMRLWIYPN